MNFQSILALVLPQKFLGIIPLYIGVELLLGVSILNKAGGAFGVLSLFTGHPITFWQWLFNMSCLIILPFYISGVSNLINRSTNVRKMSLVCLIYTFDTLVGLIYTLYFTGYWFNHEDTNPTGGDTTSGLSKREIEHHAGGMAVSPPSFDNYEKNLYQSASSARELFLTTSSILISTAVRFYFNIIIISFTRLLIKQLISGHHNSSSEAEEQYLYQEKTLLNRFKMRIFELEIRAQEYLVEFFN